MSNYFPTIGLEIHAELRTSTKMFCDSANAPHESEANVHVCPVCLGHPGTLPVPNKEAIRHVLRVGRSVGGTLATYTEFDRKNYFYPDIPKGYQISQFKFPLVSGGKLSEVALTRIHLEEDTARSDHTKEKGESHVDFNRAGVPLMELVTEPDIHSASEATKFARELQLLLRYLGASEANMEKGEMRVEANISVSDTPVTLGTKVEVKNLNSFRAVEGAIEYEIQRHIEILKKGGEIEQETRGWDENKSQTFSQRKKENSHDYRYFPDPDLPKLDLTQIEEFSEEKLDESMPELPWQVRSRLGEVLENQDQITTLLSNPILVAFYDEASADLEGKGRALVANYLTSDVLGYLKENALEVDYLANREPLEFKEVIVMVQANELSSRGAKDVLMAWLKEGGSPRKIAEANGSIQNSNEDELKVLVSSIIDDNQPAVAEYKAGKEAALQFLVGQGMKLSKGSANPAKLRELLLSELSS